MRLVTWSPPRARQNVFESLSLDEVYQNIMHFCGRRLRPLCGYAAVYTSMVFVCDQYTLETFTEVRSTAWEQEPYTGETHW